MDTQRRHDDWTRFFRNPETDRIVVAQWPNLPLWIYLAATAARILLHPHGTAATAITVVATAALLWWAGDEVVRGESPFRRVLGGVVLLATLVGLATRVV